jgi:hypothetical protein
MPDRFKNVDGVDIQLTPEEETARDAEEAAVKAAEPARAMAALRSKRNTKLTESDWTQYNDSQLSDEDKASWGVHRQSLRDLPANTDDPANPTWPSPPT